MVTKEGFDLYEAFLEGDPGPLVAKLRSDKELSAEVRNLLADILEGKLKPPPHRRARMATHEHHLMIALRVRELMNSGWKQEAAISQVTTEFPVKDRTVKYALKKLRQKEAVEAQLAAQFEARLREILGKTLQPEEVEGVIQYAKEEGKLLCK